MPNLQQMAQKEGAFSSGHRMCAGCTAPILAKMLNRVSDYEIVVSNATGCLEVAGSVFPYSAWRVPWIHTAFENAAATASGVEAMYQSLKRQGKLNKKVKFIAIGGDGGTYDIGLQSLSGAMERNHDLLYICYDNGAYMNTGIQRSSATPLGASTTTSPAGMVLPGRKGNRKDLTKIMAAHNLGYVAQGSIHKPVDLSNKIKKGIEHDGAAFVNVMAPCVPGWKIGADMGVTFARLATESNYWPLFEIIDGQYKINYKPKKEIPIWGWLNGQGRYKHLKNPKWKSVIAEFQEQINKEWQWLLEQEKG